MTERQDAAAGRDLLPEVEVEAELEPGVEAAAAVEAVSEPEAEPWVPLVLEAVAVRRDVAGVLAGQVRQPA